MMRATTDILTAAACAVAFAAVAPSLPADESMRCGQWLVSSELSTGELLNRCGAPTEKTSAISEVRTARINGHGSYVSGHTTTERWLYDRGPRAFRMVVTVVDGKIKSIDRAE